MEGLAEAQRGAPVSSVEHAAAGHCPRRIDAAVACLCGVRAGPTRAERRVDVHRGRRPAGPWKPLRRSPFGRRSDRRSAWTANGCPRPDPRAGVPVTHERLPPQLRPYPYLPDRWLLLCGSTSQDVCRGGPGLYRVRQPDPDSQVHAAIHSRLVHRAPARPGSHAMSGQ